MPYESSGRTRKAVSWILQLLVAGVFFQTLYFKFTAAPESVWIFSTLGLEPWGRIGAGIAELIAAVLILTPRTVWLGAMMALAIMGGAIASHLTRLGVEVLEDGGLLFGLALIVFLGSAGVLILRKNEIPRMRRQEPEN
ncbi:MAG: DoxX family protein [Gemmatimonadetes bacterium]|nr:DoxX family protein [Gemmatimonadota bacterium]NNM34237.1 DoxX family protein [Gemmatimonadota bacterium]